MGDLILRESWLLLGRPGLRVSDEPFVVPFSPTQVPFLQEQRPFQPRPPPNIAFLAASSGMGRQVFIPPPPAPALSWHPQYPDFARIGRVDVARYPHVFYSRRPFNPVTDATVNWFFQDFSGSSPWNGSTSLGSSSSSTLSEATNPPSQALLNSHGGASFDGVNDLFSSNVSIGTVLGNSSTQSSWGIHLVQIGGTFSDPGTGAGRVAIPSFFTEANEALNVGYCTVSAVNSVMLTVLDSVGGYTSVSQACSTGTPHIIRWRIVDNATIEIGVDSVAMTTQSFSGLHQSNVNRTGVCRVGCRGTAGGNFGQFVKFCSFVGSGTITDVQFQDFKDYINSRWAQRL